MHLFYNNPFLPDRSCSSDDPEMLEDLNEWRLDMEDDGESDGEFSGDLDYGFTDLEGEGSEGRTDDGDGSGSGSDLDEEENENTENKEADEEEDLLFFL